MESIRTKLKAVIFDMDGVLMDTEEVSIRVYRNILNEYGCEMSIEEYGQHYSGKSEEENVQTLIEQFALPLDPQNFVTEAIRLEAAELERGIKLKPGVMDILSWLRQNKIAYALATSSERRRADKLLQMHQLENTFSVRTDSSDFCRGKNTVFTVLHDKTFFWLEMKFLQSDLEDFRIRFRAQNPS